MASVIVDADGHLMENDQEIYEYLDSPYRGVPAITGYPFFPTLDGFQRGAVMGRLGMYTDLVINAKVWRQALDACARRGEAFAPAPAWMAALRGVSEGQQDTLGAYYRPWK